MVMRICEGCVWPPASGSGSDPGSGSGPPPSQPASERSVPAQRARRERRVSDMAGSSLRCPMGCLMKN